MCFVKTIFCRYTHLLNTKSLINPNQFFFTNPLFYSTNSTQNDNFGLMGNSYYLERAHGEKNLQGNSGRTKHVEEVFKGISEDLEMLLWHLYNGGYFTNAKFLAKNKFDMTCFEDVYARRFIMFALRRFGDDHKEIFTSLSSNDAKSIAMFGCPSFAKRNIFAAKQLRQFFKIKEETVCSKCVLKKSCKYANQSVSEEYEEFEESEDYLSLKSLLRLLKAYSLEEISPPLKLTDDVKASVNRLIREMISLSKSADEAAVKGSGEITAGQRS